MTCTRAGLALLVLGGGLLGGARAGAVLGGALPTVAADRARMGASIASAPGGAGTFTTHHLTRTNGGTVRELTNADGQVFAVTWAGPGKPDLRALLGPYFGAFQAANGTAGRTMHALRRPPEVNRPDLRIVTAGHMGWFRGIAYLPDLAPPGFSTRDLAADR